MKTFMRWADFKNDTTDLALSTAKLELDELNAIIKKLRKDKTINEDQYDTYLFFVVQGRKDLYSLLSFRDDEKYSRETYEITRKSLIESLKSLYNLLSTWVDLD